MSDKRLRPPASTSTAWRVVVGVGIGLLVAALVVLVVRRLRDDAPSKAAVATAPSAPAVAAADLTGTYDVTLKIASVEYGSTWPAASARLSPGQTVAQRWDVECRGSVCTIAVSGNHIPEDPNGAVVAATDDSTFEASGSVPARADAPDQPAGCGTVNAIDRQQLTLTTANDLLSGSYRVHHPTVHVEGPVGTVTGSCDSFNVVLTLTGRQVS
jgi:hypothetical protein